MTRSVAAPAVTEPHVAVVKLMQTLAAERKDAALFDLATALDYLYAYGGSEPANAMLLDWCVREIETR